MNQDFIALVEYHERVWGNIQYTGRPTLTNLLSSRIVAMWATKADLVPTLESMASIKRTITGDDRSFTFTCHDNPESLNQMLADLCLLAKTTRYAGRRLVKVFIDKKDTAVLGVRVVLKKEGTNA